MRIATQTAIVLIVALVAMGSKCPSGGGGGGGALRSYLYAICIPNTLGGTNCPGAYPTVQSIEGGAPFFDLYYTEQGQYQDNGNVGELFFKLYWTQPVEGGEILTGVLFAQDVEGCTVDTFNDFEVSEVHVHSCSQPIQSPGDGPIKVGTLFMTVNAAAGFVSESLFVERWAKRMDGTDAMSPFGGRSHIEVIE